jgi:Protein of unknown function (DUF4244)
MSQEVITPTETSGAVATSEVESPPAASTDLAVPSARRWRRDQRGMVTAEWAVGIIAAAGLAGILIIVVTHGAVRDALLQFVLHVVHFISGKI